jgi:hypothetical protein
MARASWVIEGLPVGVLMAGGLAPHHERIGDSYTIARLWSPDRFRPLVEALSDRPADFRLANLGVDGTRRT